MSRVGFLNYRPISWLTYVIIKNISVTSIQEISHKFKSLLGSDSLFVSLLILLVAVASFGLGRASLGLERVDSGPAAITLTQVTAEQPTLAPEAATEVAASGITSATSTAAETKPVLVGSKNGTKYHYLWCPGASQMKEENKVYFKSREEAEKAGYTPAANCKGL